MKNRLSAGARLGNLNKIMKRGKHQKGRTKSPKKSARAASVPAGKLPSLLVSQAALDPIDEPVHIVDRDLRIIVFNESFRVWCRDLGIDIETKIGKTVFEAFPFLHERVREEYERAIQTRARVITEEENVVSGTAIYTETRKLPIIAPDGKVTHIVTVVRNISDRHRTQEALRESEERYRLLVENVYASISIMDYDGVIEFVNQVGAEMYPMPIGELTGKSMQEIFTKDIADRQVADIREVIDSNRAVRKEAQTIIRGQVRWFDVNIQPFTDQRSAKGAVVIIAIDITERRKADEALRESEERFRVQFESLPIPAYIWESRSSDFVLTSYNNAASVITRGGIADFVGQTASEMYGAAPEVTQAMTECYSGKTVLIREMPYHFRTTGKEKYLLVYYVFAPPNQVVVYTEDITQRRQAEKSLKNSHDELEKLVGERTRELAEANEALRVEREALWQKNVALQEVLSQIEAGKKEMAQQIQSNINRIALPILKSIEQKTPQTGKRYVALLRGNLEEIAAPLVRSLETKFAQLTPRELEICYMTKDGMTCKDIAEALDTSIQTVLKQRTQIRKKLGISNQKINLTSYLKSLG